MDNEPKEKCSVRLAKALAIRGMKQSELCEKTKIPKSAISQYLSGLFESGELPIECIGYSGTRRKGTSDLQGTIFGVQEGIP